MAVQKSKCTRSKRGMRRSHDSIKNNFSLTIDKISGETHLRYHVSKNGFYKGKKIIKNKKDIKKNKLK
ncbi:MAG: 50S ribosomal protein L32 [Candidatus Makana argininalis]